MHLSYNWCPSDLCAAGRLLFRFPLFVSLHRTHIIPPWDLFRSLPNESETLCCFIFLFYVFSWRSQLSVWWSCVSLLLWQLFLVLLWSLLGYPLIIFDFCWAEVTDCVRFLFMCACVSTGGARLSTPDAKHNPLAGAKNSRIIPCGCYRSFQGC